MLKAHFEFLLLSQLFSCDYLVSRTCRQNKNILLVKLAHVDNVSKLL